MSHIQRLSVKGSKLGTFFGFAECSRFSYTPLKCLHTSKLQSCSTWNSGKILHTRKLVRRRSKGREVFSLWNNILGKGSKKFYFSSTRPRANSLEIEGLEEACIWETRPSNSSCAFYVDKPQRWMFLAIFHLTTNE